MTRYRYRTERYSARGAVLDLDALGAEGWRLVAACPVSLTGGETLLWFEQEVGPAVPEQSVSLAAPTSEIEVEPESKVA